MIDDLIKKVLDNTTFKLPSGNVKSELNYAGKEAGNELREIPIELSKHRK